MVSKPVYVISVDGAGEPHDVWEIDGSLAVRVGVPNAEYHPNAHARGSSTSATKAVLTSHLNGVFGHLAPWRLIPLQLEPGEYYPRIARPHDGKSSSSPGYCPGVVHFPDEVAGIGGQLDYLVETLQRICQVVHPEPRTLTAYGHEIRNLMIIACTEVEALWRAVMIANAYQKSRYTTDDYFRLAAPLRLREYSVELTRYPWLGPRAPFRRWSSRKPTQSLPWYDAYNAVKHDREGNFARAQLRHAIDAVVACAIMAWAQFGEPDIRSRLRERGFLRLLDRPKWRPAELYSYLHVEKADGEGHEQVRRPVNMRF